MRSIEDIAARLSHALPPQIAPMRDELHANFKAILQSQLSRLDLVPREEFDAARDLLERTRAKVDALEAQIAALDAEQPARDAGR